MFSRFGFDLFRLFFSNPSNPCVDMLLIENTDDRCCARVLVTLGSEIVSTRLGVDLCNLTMF